MKVEQLSIDERLARQLVSSQFPQWADLPIRPVLPGGWDNRSFRLGEEMLVRLPSAVAYSAQVEKEQRWLPQLAPLLPLQVPVAVALGLPTDAFPWKWSIYRWIEGEIASPERIADLREFAACLAQFLIALQRIDAADGPSPGAHNFHRGGSIATYDAEMRRAIALLVDRVDGVAAARIWEEAVATRWRRSPVWIHGDVSAGNLLMHEGRLSAVIDFGMLGTGDPACDLAITWKLFHGRSREEFRASLPFDRGTWARARGWTLWKAMIVAAGLAHTNAVEAVNAVRIIDEVLADS